ncbi:MAG: hypothetical protein NT094_00175, partial [Candidatus Staskawiczbacteria bacterium]|nr:hypothetical protein [Candidatus Staskawiczbacteria bacterium]
NANVEKFLLKQYNQVLNKSYDSIEFMKQIKLINKNPSFSDSFTFQRDINITKVIENKHKKKIAHLMNFISSFTQILEEKGLGMVFTTQTIDPKYRHKENSNIATNILFQKDILNSFHRAENKKYYFFRKVSNTTTNNSKTREFIRSLEFHKDFNLHEHTVKVFDDSLQHTINYIKMYNNNRIFHREIGRCEIVIDDKYKEGLIKHFQLKKNNDFYYSEKHFKGKLHKGNQLCIKFFKNDEKVSKQIVKYLVSYLNKSEKDIYQFIFDNLKIRNFTHSQVLFSKTLYVKIFDQLHKNKRLHAYKSLYYFTKEYQDNNIVVNFEYENTIHNNQKLDYLQALNDRFNDKLNDLDNSSKKYQKLYSHYNKFIIRHKDYFSKMIRVLKVQFLSENITISVDMNKYKVVSHEEYKKLKKVDSEIYFIQKELSKFTYIQDNHYYEELQEQYSHKETDTLEQFIQKDMMQESITNKHKERYSRYTDIINIPNEILGESLKSDDFYFKVAANRLENTIENFNISTSRFRSEQINREYGIGF